MESNEPVKRGRGRPPKKPGDPPAKRNNPTPEPVLPGDNAKAVSDMVSLMKPRIKSDDECEERIREYFQWCIDNDKKPSVAALAVSLGYNYRTLNDWQTGVTIVSDRRIELITQAKAVINAVTEGLMQDGKFNPVVGIFLLKNHAGYRDQQEMVLTPHNPLGTMPDKQLLEAKYSDLPD